MIHVKSNFASFFVTEINFDHGPSFHRISNLLQLGFSWFHLRFLVNVGFPFLGLCQWDRGRGDLVLSLIFCLGWFQLTDRVYTDFWFWFLSALISIDILLKCPFLPWLSHWPTQATQHLPYLDHKSLQIHWLSLTKSKPFSRKVLSAVKWLVGCSIKPGLPIRVTTISCYFSQRWRHRFC